MSRMDSDPNEERMEGWMLDKHVFVFLWAGILRLQLLVANRPNISEAGGLVGLHFMWVHTVPSIRRTVAPQGLPRGAGCLAPTATYPPDICSCYKYTR